MLEAMASAPQTRHQRGGIPPASIGSGAPHANCPRGVESVEVAALPATDEDLRLPGDEPLTEWATLCAAGMPMAGGTPGVLASRALKESSRSSIREASCSTLPRRELPPPSGARPSPRTSESACTRALRSANLSVSRATFCTRNLVCSSRCRLRGCTS